MKCEVCQGSGVFHESICYECRGDGSVLTVEDMNKWEDLGHGEI